MEELRKFISDDTIPEFIGGSKKTIDSMTVNEALENRDTKTNDVTTERSLIGNRSPRRF
jgi:hypothetical protein